MKSIMKTIKQNPIRFILVVIVLSAISCVSMTTYGFDLEYLSPQNWEQNPNVISQNISKKSNNNTLYGVFKYYINPYDNIIYTYFSVTESSLTEKYKNVQILYKITSAIDEQYVTVDSNGMREGDPGLFRARQNFYTSADKGEYISAIEINNGYESNIVEVRISFNGHNYKIAEDIVIKTLSKNELTASQTTTQVRTAKQETPKAFNNTSKAKTTSKTQTTKKITTGTTKFRYNPDEPAPYSTTEKATSSAIIGNHNTRIASNSAEPKMSSASKAILASGTAFGVLGTIIIIASAIKKDNNK